MNGATFQLIRSDQQVTLDVTVTMLDGPNGGEIWTVGEARAIQWTATPEAGVDGGVVDLDLSTDGGGSWAPIVSDTANDGHHPWTVPDAPGGDLRVRVIRPNQITGPPPGYPDACSSDASDASFTVQPSPDVAGTVGGDALRLAKIGAGMLRLTWTASCSTDATDYALYEGGLSSLVAGGWDHAPARCGTGGALSADLLPGNGARYYLVAPLADGEGRLGADSLGVDRPVSVSACAQREASSECN